MNYLALKRKPVTLILGIICKDGVVISADSQTTWGSKKSWNARKMTGFGSAHGQVLVAESGSVLSSQRIAEGLEAICQDQAFAALSMRDCAEKAAMNERSRLRSVHFDCTSEELQRNIEINELDCSLMIAHQFEGTPSIDTIDLSTATVFRCKGIFEAIGSGSDLASYLLEDFMRAEYGCYNCCPDCGACCRNSQDQ
jgi:ATP-dependent protease HslVU (ClpYQ) peptidase subunit